MNRILTANLVVVSFPGPQVDFLEAPEEGVAVQMDLKKKRGFTIGQYFAFSRKIFHFSFNLPTNVPNHFKRRRDVLEDFS